jgi:hypothetical protein
LKGEWVTFMRLVRTTLCHSECWPQSRVEGFIDRPGLFNMRRKVRTLDEPCHPTGLEVRNHANRPENRGDKSAGIESEQTSGRLVGDRYRIPALSGLASTATGRLCGLIIPNATRKIP